MTTPERRHLWKSVLAQTGRDPDLVGFWLRRHRRAEHLRPAQLARQLGLGMEGLVLLSLCRTPRADRFREDLEVICRRCGAEEAALARVLRQQQALAHWAEQAPPAEGWLMAAADAVPPPEDEEPEGPAAGEVHET